MTPITSGWEALRGDPLSWLLDDARHAAVLDLGHAEALRIVHLLQEDASTGRLIAEALSQGADHLQLSVVEGNELFVRKQPWGFH